MREQFSRLEDFILKGQRRLENYERADRETAELIESVARATTAEERWAHVEKLKATRARIINN